ncbi:SDR family NAD(P)-dependent oxidoreductase [Dechloromonas sp.]|uniref:SDR family NAD(P)-dependent oxidoreductase n=1 Tax=Dechloromonas sp. TaxID=1917218 RepID=UPI0021725BF7|nr:SDR family oxidoreductase [Dechloromonas sp.]MBU3696367.1 SDR family oxidoreductase [Dechloromonas sp.]
MSNLALITGAAGGLGQAVVKRLAADGWQLALVGRDAVTLQAAYGEAHLQIVADCSTTDGVALIFKRLQEAGLTATALAHCVGNIRLSPLHRMREADFNDCLSANLISAFHTLAGFVGSLRTAQQPGAAVLVSSVAARIGTPNHEAIAAAKAGVEGLVRGAAATYAATGIRINAVAPGIMATPGAAGILASPVSREAAARQYPLPGIGEPAELAELMAWLLSPHAARVTGQIWALDGGFSSIRPLVRGA